jgi:cysteine-rich repeat protein
VRKTCLQQGTELGCAGTPNPIGDAHLLVPVKVGDVLFVVVQGYSASDAGAFTLALKNRAVKCGDGHTDPPEACDDGNTTAGDGCGASCSVESTETEPNNVPAQANAYGAPWFAAIGSAGDVDLIKVDVTQAPGTLSAIVGDFDGGCQTGQLDSYLEILDKNGSTVLASDDNGMGTCSAAMAGGLAAGTYFVRVKASPAAAGSTFAYKLTVNVTQDVCGDGMKTGAEQCDDGNTAAGDGCSPMCLWEITEKEPNNTTAQANTYKPQPPWRAKIGPAGDVDVVAITLQAPGQLDAHVTDGKNGDCVAQKIISHVDILDTDGTTVLASDSGVGGNYCAIASAPGLASGKYYVRVKAGPLATPGVNDTFDYGLDLTVQ